MEGILFLAVIFLGLYMVVSIKSAQRRREREKQVAALRAAADELSKKKHGFFR
jgi:cell division protein FtsB